MNKALVTGGCGFIGSHMVDKLVNDEGYFVTVIDDLSATHSHDQFYFNDDSNSVEYFHEDISLEYDKVERAMEGAEFVFHFAAKSRIQLCIEDPLGVVRVNALGTGNVLEAARRQNVSRVMYSSTSSAYGLKNEIPLREDMKTDCLNPYSVTKVTGEELCKIYSQIYDVETISFRYFNVYGEREPVRGIYAPVVGKFLKQFKNGEEMTVVGDGLQTRDFTHVSDVVNANWLAATSKTVEPLGQVYNVGSGVNHSVMDLVQYIGGEYVHIPERPGEARDTLADITKIKIDLGWEPTKDLFNDYIKEEMI